MKKSLALLAIIAIWWVFWFPTSHQCEVREFEKIIIETFNKNG
jgi:hypothetical protein